MTSTTMETSMVKDKEQETARRSNHKVEQLRALLARAQAYSHFLAGRLGGPVALGCGSAIDESPSVAVSPRVCGQREGGRGRRRRRGGMPSDDDDGGCRASLEKEQAGREDARTDFMQPRTVVGGTLRGYQLEGVQWLVSLFENGLNGILADEMGLGKTVQCIAFVAFLREQGVLGPFLIVAPLSTLANWMSEFERFAPTIPILMYHGSQSAREEMRSKCHLAKPNAQSFSVLVTSYEIAMRDARHLGSITWKYMIIDEGHRLKNLNCRLIRELKAYKSDNRLLLTGTPLQNNLTELWSLLNFLLPEIFTDVDDFLSWFDLDLEAEGLGEHERADDDSDSNMTGMAASMVEDERAEMISKLHSILKPLLLRRLKSDVESDLPRKKEYVLSASLSPLQREYYQIVLQGRAHQLVQRNERRGREGEEATPLSDKRRRTGRRRRKSHVIPDKDDADSVDEEMSSNEDPPTIEPARAFYSSAQGLQNRIMQLRKVCNHPYLFLHPTHPEDPTRLLVDEQLVQCSGKMRLLDQLLDALRQEDHKVLIFSQMSRMLDILGNFLDLRDIQYCRIDGSVAQTERQQEVHRFNTQPSVGVFLLSTRAGGLGLNLVAADTVIFYDSDWNPQMDLQAQDRVHRIGQTRPVLVFRLSTAGTVEGRILERAASKRKLERLVIHKRKFKGREQLLLDHDDRLLAEELAEILRGRDDEQIQLEAGGQSQQRPAELTAKELETILDRSDAAFARTNWSTDAVRIVTAPSSAMGGKGDTS